MKTGFHAKLIAVFTAALAITMFSLPAFAAEGGASDPAGTQQAGLQAGTLAIIDTQAMMKSQFVNTLTEMTLVIRNEVGNLEETGVHFYDELKSYYNSIEYSNYELFDLGNLAALLSVVNSEVSEDHIDEIDNYYINANNYHDISRTLNRMLVDETFMYARGTSGITTKELFYRTLDDQLGHGKLGSSGMSVFFPGDGHKLKSIYYMNANAAQIQVEPKNLTREIAVMPALVAKRKFDPDDSAATQQLFANLFAAQNALTEAQNELTRTRDALGKEQMAEMEDQIAQLEQRIENLVEQLAEASVVDISNYEVTMQASFPYVR